jgi:hypothetical protein
VQKVILWWLRRHTPARDCHLWTLDNGFKQTLSEFLPLFLQKESGFQGKALRISTGEKAFCTLFTDERLKKVDKNFKLSNALRLIYESFAQTFPKVCGVRGKIPNPHSFSDD